MEIVFGLLIITIGIADFIRDRAYAKRLMILEMAVGGMIEELDLLDESYDELED